MAVRNDAAVVRNPVPTRTPMRPSNTTAPSTVTPQQPATTTTRTPVRTDAFDATRTPRTDPRPNGGLPDVVFKSGNAEVSHGTDPGNFYCEHMFFSTQKEAMKSTSGVTTNANGEKLVGFLHVPWDNQTTAAPDATIDQAQRHAGTREVVGTAIRGYVDDAAQKVPKGPIRIQLNGYDTFMSVTNNATKDFVSHKENIDAAMKAGFGNNLVTPEGQPYTDPSGKQPKDGTTLQYVVRDEATRKVRTVLVHAHAYPVTDSTINKSASSVQKTMQDFKPHAVLSMGVAADKYMAEFHADSGGMRTKPTIVHDDAAPATENLPDNRSLARALVNGQKAVNKASTTTVAALASAQTGPSSESVGAAARRLINEHANNYGVQQPWFNVDPNHALPPNVPLGGLKGRWKCNLFGGNAIAAGGFEPPYYGNKGKGEYPNANQFYKWSDKYAKQYGNKTHFAMQGELDIASTPYDQREAKVREVLATARPGDLILVDHPGDAVSDGGHTRVVVANNLDKDGTVQSAQAGSQSGEIRDEGVSSFTGDDHIWVLRPNKPRAAETRINP